MDNASIITAYKRYARNYDRLFGLILDPGRRLVVEKMSCLPEQTSEFLRKGWAIAP